MMENHICISGLFMIGDPKHFLSIYFWSNFWVEELLMVFRHVAFLPSLASLSITFHKNFGRGASFGNTTCPKAVVGVCKVMSPKAVVGVSKVMSLRLWFG